MGNLSYQSSTWEYQQPKTEITVINADATNYWLKLLPNISLSDDKFYIIDGTTADVDIGAVEPIKFGDGGTVPLPGLYKTTVETTVETFEATGCV